MTRAQVKRYRAKKEREAQHRAAVEAARAELIKQQEPSLLKDIAYCLLALAAAAIFLPLALMAIDAMLDLI